MQIFNIDFFIMTIFATIVDYKYLMNVNQTIANPFSEVRVLSWFQTLNFFVLKKMYEWDFWFKIKLSNEP